MLWALKQGGEYQSDNLGLVVVLSLPLILSKNDINWHTKQETTISFKVAAHMMLQTLTSDLLSVFLLPSSLLIQNSEKPKFRDIRQRNIPQVCLKYFFLQ